PHPHPRRGPSREARGRPEGHPPQMRIALAALILASLLAQEDPKLRELIERLSDDEIRVREKAVADLVNLGKAAVPALQRLSASGDVELRSRAASVLKLIAEGE